MVVKKIGVIGAGQMGHGIALVSAQAGYDVIPVSYTHLTLPTN